LRKAVERKKEGEKERKKGVRKTEGEWKDSRRKLNRGKGERKEGGIKAEG
jgi:hypothetical protein